MTRKKWAVVVIGMVALSYIGYKTFGPKPTAGQCRYRCVDVGQGAKIPMEGVKAFDRCVAKCMGWPEPTSSSY